jgi:peptide chain release factor 1
MQECYGEIRAGTGGDETSNILQGICSVCIPIYENQGWRTSVVDMNEGTSGGFKRLF